MLDQDRLRARSPFTRLLFGGERRERDGRGRLPGHRRIRTRGDGVSVSRVRTHYVAVCLCAAFERDALHPLRLSLLWGAKCCGGALRMLWVCVSAILIAFVVVGLREGVDSALRGAGLFEGGYA